MFCTGGGVFWTGGGVSVEVTGRFWETIRVPCPSGPPSTGVQGRLRLVLQSTRE